MRLLITVLFLGFTLYSFFDCARTEQERIRRGPKWAWLLGILLFESLGAILWFLVARPKRNPGQWGPRSTGKMIPPDDDPDFLRKL